LHPEGLLFIA